MFSVSIPEKARGTEKKKTERKEITLDSSPGLMKKPSYTYIHVGQGKAKALLLVCCRVAVAPSLASPREPQASMMAAAPLRLPARGLHCVRGVAGSPSRPAIARAAESAAPSMLAAAG